MNFNELMNLFLLNNFLDQIAFRFVTKRKIDIMNFKHFYNFTSF